MHGSPAYLGQGHRNHDWLARLEGRVQFHFRPTSASWLNQIEIVFSLLPRKTLSEASFQTKDQLRQASSEIPVLIYAIKY